MYKIQMLGIIVIYFVVLGSKSHEMRSRNNKITLSVFTVT